MTPQVWTDATQLPVVVGQPRKLNGTPKQRPDEWYSCNKATCEEAYTLPDKDSCNRCYPESCAAAGDGHYPYARRYSREVQQRVDVLKMDPPKEHKHQMGIATNGSGWLERKANGELLYHAPWLAAAKPRPFAMPPLKPRVETAARTYERLAKLKLELVEKITGRPAAKGYEVAATNGHVALLKAGPGKGEKRLEWLGDTTGVTAATKGYKAMLLDNPELQLAVKRALTMADERSGVVRLQGKAGVLTVSSSHSKYGSFEETLAYTGPDFAPIGFNGKAYLEPVFGCWPLLMWIKDSDSAVVFEPVGKWIADLAPWRFVVMPYRI